MRRRLENLLLVSLILGTLAVPAGAFGANPSDPGGIAGQTQDLVSVQGGAGLPFTGLNLALIVIGGLVLLGTGIVLRRLNGSNEK
jgi:uncharacterized membrane protein